MFDVWCIWHVYSIESVQELITSDYISEQQVTLAWCFSWQWLDADVLAGMPIMKSNGICKCPFKHQLTIDEKADNISSASDKQKLSTYSKCLTLYSIQVLKDVMFIWVS